MAAEPRLPAPLDRRRVALAAAEPRRPAAHRRSALAIAAAAVVATVAAGAARASAADRSLGEAAAHFEGGEYDEVVALLRAPIEAGAPRDPAERAQALRLYGIACVLTSRPQAAEDAFLRWLKLEPRAWLDTTIVRPEVAEFFNGVRARHRAELLREVERRRPRSAILNVTPPAGQYQNRQHLKFGVVLGAEITLAGVSLGSYLALKSLQRDDKTFPDNDLAQRLVSVNWISTAALLAVILYGIVDGFVYYHRIQRDLSIDEAILRAEGPPLPSSTERRLAAGDAPRLRLGVGPGGLALTF